MSSPPSPPRQVVEQLDYWLPEHGVRVGHHRSSSAPSAALWAHASALQLDDCRALGHLVRWRIPDLRPDLTFERLVHEPPFLLLHESDELVISGLVGRIWTLRRDYPQLPDGEAYRAWNRSGTARVLFGIWSGQEAERSSLSVEVRIQAFGVQGRIGVAALSPMIRSFEHLLSSEALRVSVQRAETVEDAGPAGAPLI